MSWSWDPYKNEENKRKHGISFEVAQYAFNDPIAVTTINPYPYEERFATIGMVRRQAHTGDSYLEREGFRCSRRGWTNNQRQNADSL